MSFRIRLNPAGVRELLQSEEIRADIERRGHKIAARAGDGMEVETTTGPNRAHVTVRTATTDARVAEATARVLTQAIDAGR